MKTPQLKLNGLTFEELFQPDALQRLDQRFLNTLKQHDASLHNALLRLREDPDCIEHTERSTRLIQAAEHLESFLADLFGITDEVEAARLQTRSNDPIFVFKEWYVLRQAKRRLGKSEGLTPFATLDAWLDKALAKESLVADDRELAIARLGQHYLNDQTAHAIEIEQLTQWCIQAMTSPEGQRATARWVSFLRPQKRDFAHLVETWPVEGDPINRLEGPPGSQRRRDGFNLVYHNMTERDILDQVHYCVNCHTHEGDFCSKGFPENKTDGSQGVKTNPLGEVMTGCPLDEKISEMHVLKGTGHTLGALAMVMIDNPMCPATGHRVCNDCRRACIYQKQDPVDIPKIETGVLLDVLNLPWGVEIYDLLTRWNPLRPQQWAPRPYNGHKVMIVGTGPAGFGLAHHLLQEGFGIVNIEATTIEPLPKALIEGPIHRYADITETRDGRIAYGFGGATESGITARWDKNFLKLIYLCLMRRPYFQLFGGIHLGSTLTLQDVWALGLDHLSLAAGAGIPNALRIPGSEGIGMVQAGDFLTTLQLGGAAKPDNLTVLQLRLPAIVIGTGLTGIDTATETQAYYIVQVEKTLARYEQLVKTRGEAAIRAAFDPVSLEILDEFLAHGRMIREERERAKAANEELNLNQYIRQWGGVTMIARRDMQTSPAYTDNHHELVKALNEGIYYAEGLEPTKVGLDEHGHVQSLICAEKRPDETGKWSATGEERTIPVRSVFVSIGTRPDTTYENEHPGTFELTNKDYCTFVDQGGSLAPAPTSESPTQKHAPFGPFTSYERNHHRVSFVGDLHPVFRGNVVRALASAKRTYPMITQHVLGQQELKKTPHVGDDNEYQQFQKQLQDRLRMEEPSKGTEITSAAQNAQQNRTQEILTRLWREHLRTDEVT